MPYEVVKRRGSRAYRYSVEYCRDENGKGRTRWTYQGPVDDEAPPKHRREAAEQRTATQASILDALERLLEQRDYTKITADAIATEAALAHGTFYRYFKDKREALRTAMARLAERLERIAKFDESAGSLETERARLGAWVEATLGGLTEHAGIWRAWTALSATDPQIADIRRKLRADALTSMTGYLRRLDELGYARVEEPATHAKLILATVEGLLRTAGIDAAPIDQPTIRAAQTFIERAVFGVR